jgi:hypothetical protein
MTTMTYFCRFVIADDVDDFADVNGVIIFVIVLSLDAKNR